MTGLEHLIVVLFAILGLVLGGVLIDLDHSGTWSCKLDKFLHHNVTCPTERGIFHRAVVSASIIAFSFSLAISYLLHIITDAMQFTGFK